MPSSKLIIIDNTLGAGKTTLINKLCDRNPSWFQVAEGVSLSEDSILHFSDKYFTDYTQSKLASRYSEAIKHPVFISDRIFSAPKYWANYENREISEYTNLLIERIKDLLKNTKIYYFYLNDPTPDKSILLANIKNRGRDFEQHYITEKLDNLENIYQGCIADLDGLDYKIYVFNLTKDFYDFGHLWIESIVNS